MRLRNPKTPWNLRTLLFLSKVTSNYGESWLRPVLWFLGVLFVGALIGLNGGLLQHKTARQLSLTSIADWGEALGFLLATAFHIKVSENWFEPTTVSNTLSLWTGILCPIFLALTILGIRNRLKR